MRESPDRSHFPSLSRLGYSKSSLRPSHVVRLIMEAHAVRVWAKSEVGNGSSFRFALPLEALAHQTNLNP